MMGAMTPVLGWQLDPVLIGGLLTLATTYALAVGPLRERLAPGAPFPIGRAAWFYGALAFVYLVEGSPLHDLAERYSLSAHMTQHLLLSYLAAPMLIWGTPTWILRPLLMNRVMAPITRVLTSPVVAFSVFTVLFSAWHIPAIYDGALRNTSLHHFEHGVFLASSLLLWWPLMNPLPEIPAPSALVKLVYLFTLPIAQIPVFGAVTFADHILYDTYANAGWNLGLSARDDQALGGALMKVIGLFTFGIPFAVIFFRWYQRENARPGDAARAVEDAPVATPAAR